MHLWLIHFKLCLHFDLVGFGLWLYRLQRWEWFMYRIWFRVDFVTVHWPRSLRAPFILFMKFRFRRSPFVIITVWIGIVSTMSSNSTLSSVARFFDSLSIRFNFCFSYLPQGNNSQRKKLKKFLTLLDVFEFGSFENFTRLNLDAWSLDHINVYEIYRMVGEISWCFCVYCVVINNFYTK